MGDARHDAVYKLGTGCGKFYSVFHVDYISRFFSGQTFYNFQDLVHMAAGVSCNDAAVRCFSDRDNMAQPAGTDSVFGGLFYRIQQQADAHFFRRSVGADDYDTVRTGNNYDLSQCHMSAVLSH